MEGSVKRDYRRILHGGGLKRVEKRESRLYRLSAKDLEICSLFGFLLHVRAINFPLFMASVVVGAIVIFIMRLYRIARIYYNLERKVAR